jgi:hypothetical protein
MGIFNRLFGNQNEPTRDAVPSTDAAEFSAGDRVKDAFGSLGTVEAVDPSGEHGMGSVRVKMDDGRDINVALIASGLERVEGA